MEGPLPNSWPDAARWLLGGVFIFVAGFEGYVMLWDGRFVAGITSVAIAFAMTAVLVSWNQIEAWAGTQFAEATKRAVTHPATWLGTIMIVLLLIALSPFIEERTNPVWSLGIVIAIVVAVLAGFGALGYSLYRGRKANPRAKSSRVTTGAVAYVGTINTEFDKLVTDHYIVIVATCFNLSDNSLILRNTSGSIRLLCRKPSSAPHFETDLRPLPQFRGIISQRTVGPEREFGFGLIQIIPGELVSLISDTLNHGDNVEFDLRELEIEATTESGVPRSFKLWEGITCRISPEKIHTARVINLYATLFDSSKGGLT